MCGWMYLLQGKKTFQMWDPVFREQLFNKEAEKLHDPRVFPLPTEKNIPPTHTFTIGPNDLIWIPAGSFLLLYKCNRMDSQYIYK